MKNTIIFVHNIEYPQQWAVDIYYYSKFLSKYSNYNIKVIVSKINENIISDNLEIIELWKINYFLLIFRSLFEIRKIKNKCAKAEGDSLEYVYFH